MTAWVTLLVGLFLSVCLFFWLVNEISASRKHKRDVELLKMGIKPENIRNPIRDML